MSIRRIESAYAYFFDKEISGTQMAVLQALAYCANAKEGDKCYPSIATLAKMTHFSTVAVGNACSALRDMHIISWVQGGYARGVNLANFYKFEFPETDWTSRREQYKGVKDTPSVVSPKHVEGVPNEVGGVSNDVGGVPRDAGRGTQPRLGGSPTTLGGVPNDVITNTECNPQSNSQSKPKSNSESKKAVRSFDDFDFSSVVKRVNCGDLNDSRKAKVEIGLTIFGCDKEELARAAVLVCGLKDTDTDNLTTFSHYVSSFSRYENGIDDLREQISLLFNERALGCHNKEKNLASILSTRLDAKLAGYRSNPAPPKTSEQQVPPSA